MSITINNSPSGTEIVKALQDGKIPAYKGAVPKSAIIDPTNNVGIMGVRSKPSFVSYQVLRRMAQVPAIAAIINTRLNQVARFAKRPRFDGDLGFKVVLKDRKTKMTEVEKRRAHEIEEFFLRTGAVPNKKRKDNFDTFLRKVTRDSLTLDALTWENVSNYRNGMSEIWAVDAATIEIVRFAPIGELLEPTVYEPVTKRGQSDAGEIAYVQRVNGQITAEFTEEELAYAVRNPRTDLDYTDFGLSELETTMEIVTGIVNSVRYNSSYFTASHLPQGVLELIGTYKDEHMEQFQRHWKALTSGAPGKWAVPVMALNEGQGFKFTNFKNSNRDMEFNEFLEFLFNIACAVYQIDPNEVGFKSWTSGNSMTASDNTEAKMDGSKDKGFVPLMNFLSNTFTSELINEIDDNFEFVWVGVNEEDEDKKLEREKLQLDMGTKTVAMLWSENDVDVEEIKKQNGGELPLWSNAPANPQLVQVYMAELEQKQAEEQQAQQQENSEKDREYQQAQADDQHKKQLDMVGAQHTNQLAIMDKQHEHAMKQKEPEKKAGGVLKKSMTEEEDGSMTIELDIEGEWGRY